MVTQGHMNDSAVMFPKKKMHRTPLRNQRWPSPQLRGSAESAFSATLRCETLHEGVFLLLL